MAILAQSRVCPFKEDKDLIKQIDYKQYKFLRKFITDTKCKCTYECAMTTNTLFNGDMFVKVIKQTAKDVFKR